jgi:hypothetical protein
MIWLQTSQWEQWIMTGMATWVDEANNGMIKTTWRWQGGRMMGQYEMVGTMMG